MKFKSAVLLSLLAAVIFFGCGKQADLNKPIDQIRTEVQTMSVNDLQGYAQSYATAIQAKKSELQKVGEQMKTLKPTEFFSEKAKAIRDQIGKSQSQISGLMERYNIYLSKLQEKGADISKVKLQ